MKLRELLNEGTWSSPDDMNKANRLAQMLHKPMPAGKAADKLYNLVGDDDLFDSIGEVEEKDGPDVDVRALVVAKLEEWIKDGEETDWEHWRRPWTPNAIAVLKKAIKRWR